MNTDTYTYRETLALAAENDYEHGIMARYTAIMLRCWHRADLLAAATMVFAS